MVDVKRALKKNRLLFGWKLKTVTQYLWKLHEELTRQIILYVASVYARHFTSLSDCPLSFRPRDDA